jgi:hypothetical protein
VVHVAVELGVGVRVVVVVGVGVEVAIDAVVGDVVVAAVAAVAGGGFRGAGGVEVVRATHHRHLHLQWCLKHNTDKD